MDECIFSAIHNSTFSVSLDSCSTSTCTGTVHPTKSTHLGVYSEVDLVLYIWSSNESRRSFHLKLLRWKCQNRWRIITLKTSQCLNTKIYTWNMWKGVFFLNWATRILALQFWKHIIWVGVCSRWFDLSTFKNQLTMFCEFTAFVLHCW